MVDQTSEKLGLSPLDLKMQGKPLTDAQQSALPGEIKRINKILDEAEQQAKPFGMVTKSEVASLIDAIERKQEIPPDDRTKVINEATQSELLMLKNANVITNDDYIQLRKKYERGTPVNDRSSIASTLNSQPSSYATLVESATGVQVEYRNLTPSQTKDWITSNVPQSQRQGLNTELHNFETTGGKYSVSIGRDGRGAFRLVKFQLPSPWTSVKREAQQSVTREIRREVGKQGNRLINPDYAHNEIINQYKLVRAALPGDTAVKKALDKTDSVVSAVLTSTGLAAEATNLLVNAIRGALLESPELKYKVAALVPDDLVRQGYVATVRTAGNTLREFIHKKYNLPDRPKKTPVIVNTLDQIKPEHYRQQDAQKVGITMRDLNREDAIKFIRDNVPVEKQESAIETIGKLKGNQFGVSIMDSGWVRIDASAREPRKYEDRNGGDHQPAHRQLRVGSYDAAK